MLRRVLSVLRLQPALRRHAFAGAAALGLALACLNPQNDDLPSSNFSGDGTVANNPSDQGDDNSPNPPGNTSGPPDLAPEPQQPGAGQGLPPPANEPSAPTDGGDDPEEASDDPDAGAPADAGGASASDVAP